MDFLVFQLKAPLAAWGDTAVGEFRPTVDYPGQSALLGLLAAALGLRRDQADAHRQLAEHYGFAVGVQSGGKLLRDYHTAQVAGQAALKKRPHFTRKDELAIPKQDLHTVLSTRDYRQDAACLVAVQALSTDAAAPYSLEQLAAALRTPRYTLYLGRKSCPPAAPLFPQVVNADSALAAMEHYRQALESVRQPHADHWQRLPLEDVAPIDKLAWGAGVEAGAEAQLTTSRKDRLIHRYRWQFGERSEFLALFREDT